MQTQSRLHKAICSIINSYSENDSINYLTTLKEASRNCNGEDGNVLYLYDGQEEYAVLSCDYIAQRIYRKILWPESNKYEDSVASVDACIAPRDDILVFIEFKDQSIDRSKNEVRKKGIENWYMLMDMIFSSYSSSNPNEYHDIIEPILDNPTQYARNSIRYVLVFSADKDPKSAEKVREQRKAKGKYVPPFMEKIRRHWFVEAYAVTTDELERLVVGREEW